MCFFIKRGECSHSTYSKGGATALPQRGFAPKLVRVRFFYLLFLSSEALPAPPTPIQRLVPRPLMVDLASGGVLKEYFACGAKELVINTAKVNKAIFSRHISLLS